MSQEERNQQTLEIVIGERVLTRLKTQVLAIYLGSFVLAAALGSALTWQYHSLATLSDSRVAEYRLLVAEKLEELHRLDLQEVARRTRPALSCETALDERDAFRLLEAELGRAPHASEHQQLLDTAAGFGVCDIGEVKHILEDAVNVARVDTAYRLLLGRPADPIGRFIYGYWLASGVDVGAVGRDIMTSTEFQKLKKLATDS
ncbi:MAG TPA: hypothetical protein VLK65_28765 [Vicinamibacteria bacterium]|nr:hypothetical protein [Vicinamibacteria bacterium]